MIAITTNNSINVNPRRFVPGIGSPLRNELQLRNEVRHEEHLGWNQPATLQILPTDKKTSMYYCVKLFVIFHIGPATNKTHN